jgi:hypothetical protein
MAIAITHGNKKRWLPIVMTLLILVSFGIGIDRVYYYGNYNKISSTSIRTLSMPPLTSSFIDRYLMTSIVALALLMAIAITHGNKKR